ncbi:histidine transporter [Gammaproteobacteria bacterium]|nr:histidine transporter [Gammaproteobacteria bacterium]
MNINNKDNNNFANKNILLFKMFLMSMFGIGMFFIPFSLNSFGITQFGAISKRSSIFVDHLSVLFITQLRPIAIIFLIGLMLYGVVAHFLMRKSKRLNIGEMIFGIFKLFGLILAIAYLVQLYVVDFLPIWVMESSKMLPFLFEKLALSVGMLIPIGAIALTFLIGFGLLDMMGVLMEKIMRPLFRTPGYSSVDAVTSFVGSYSIGLLITNRMYLEGRYSCRDAVIIATGFSTVSATFMVIVSSTLQIMEHWNFYFWSTLIVAFAVTAVTARLPPITRMDASYTKPHIENTTDSRLSQAITAAITQVKLNPSLLQMMFKNLKEGLAMSAIVAPSILAVGFTGMCVYEFTPFFEYLGYCLKPALWLAGLILNVDFATHSAAFSSGLAEMFLPAILLKDTGLAIKFVAAITAVSSILFFSGCIPCILATKIPISIKALLMIWLLRTSLSIVFSALIVWLGFNFGLF